MIIIRDTMVEPWFLNFVMNGTSLAGWFLFIKEQMGDLWGLRVKLKRRCLTRREFDARYSLLTLSSYLSVT